MRGRWRTTQSPRRRVASAVMLGLLVAMFPAVALAHSGPPPVPETLWSTWTLDPFVLLVTGLGSWLYIRGVRALWSRAGTGKGVKTWQVVAGIGGYLTILIALVSPLDPLSHALFSAHMGQHVLLIMVAPLLLILANVSAVSIWGLPAQWRRKIPGFWRQAGFVSEAWSQITRPLIALALHSLVLWIWHVPAFYNAAVRNEFIHALEHITMFGTAAIFWWMVLQRGRHAGLNYGIGLLMLFGLVLQKTALGALIAFSPSPWYAEYATSTAAWGLTPYEDQQLAGAVLMGPGGFIYLIVGVMLFAGWFRAIERSVERRESYLSPTLATEQGPNQRTEETV